MLLINVDPLKLHITILQDNPSMEVQSLFSI